jgi:solute carrier family 25 (mitochondrial carnitine/acylcarnitine transporter), member 20/29
MASGDAAPAASAAAAPPVAAAPARRGTLVGSGSGTTEGLRGLTCGLLFGLASPIVGHPLDTIKTKMQTSHLRGNSLSVFRDVIRVEGARGLFRGILPPLLGSSI